MNILEYSSYFKLIQAVGIPWILKIIQAHKSWNFLEIPISIFLEAELVVETVDGPSNMHYVGKYCICDKVLR